MNEVQLRVKGAPGDLEQLQEQLLGEMKGEVQVRPINSHAPGEMREPVLTALVLGLTPVAIRNLRKLLERYMEHREKMEELSLYRDGDREITIEELKPEAFSA